METIAAEMAELRRMALASPGTTRLLDVAMIGALERLAAELERLEGELRRARWK